MSSAPKHYPALDGLRGLAILLVVVYHNFGFINYFFFGWLGVDLFFVLSGFLITTILIRTVNQQHYLRNFYMRRVLRIFPLYYACLILFLVILPRIGILSQELAYYRQHSWWLWSYLQNWLYIFNPSHDTTMLHHFWSLAVEEQFYLLWPLVILWVRKPAYLLLLLAITLLLVMGIRVVVWNQHIENLAYFNFYTFSRIDGICIGSMLALVRIIDTQWITRYNTVLVLGFAAINFAFFFINRYSGFNFPFVAIIGYTTFAFMLALLVNEALEDRNKVVKLLFDNTIMRFFGRISYGFYVFHWPVYLIIAPRLAGFFESYLSPRLSLTSASLLSTALAVVISVFSYRYFESFFIRKKKAYQ